MSIPVIALRDAEAAKVEELRKNIRSLKQQIDALEETKKNDQTVLDDMLNEVAMINNADYRHWYEQRKQRDGHFDNYRYDIELSDDGKMVVIVRRHRR